MYCEWTEKRKAQASMGCRNLNFSILSLRRCRTFAVETAKVFYKAKQPVGHCRLLRSVIIIPIYSYPTALFSIQPQSVPSPGYRLPHSSVYPTPSTLAVRDQHRDFDRQNLCIAHHVEKPEIVSVLLRSSRSSYHCISGLHYDAGVHALV